MFDFEAPIASVRAAREDKGLNVHFVREDGTPDSFSFATPERATAFAASLRRQGRTVTSNH
jgi:hypothetical protein